MVGRNLLSGLAQLLRPPPGACARVAAGWPGWVGWAGLLRGIFLVTTTAVARTQAERTNIADPERRWLRSQVQDIASELAGTAASSARVQSR